MSPLLRLAFLSAVTVVLFGAAASAVVAWAYPRVRIGLAGLAPETRARRVLGWAALPWLAALALLALCFVPSFWSFLGLAADHCPVHGDGHVHLCLAHAPHHPVSLVEVLLLLAGGLATGAVAFGAVRAQVATWRAVAALRSMAGHREGEDELVPSSAPLSVTAGLLWPLVLVSTGLRRQLSRGQLRAVLAHERAHARRRDPLRLFAVSLLGAAHGPATRRQLAADLALACEAAADEQAAREVGDRILVAESILAVERLLGARAPRPGVALGMAGCASEARVEALLADPLPPAPATAGQVVRWAAVLAVALAAASEIHHLTETLLDLIAR